MSQTFLRNRKGFILIFTYIVITLLIVLTGIFLIRSINESRVVNRSRDAEEALALAEKGVAYAVSELRLRAWRNWYTHVWDTDAAGDWILVANDDPETYAGGPTIQTLDERCQFGERFLNRANQRAAIGGGGSPAAFEQYNDSYFVPEVSGKDGYFFVRTYRDFRPEIADGALQEAIEQSVIVIRSIGVVRGTTRRAVEQRLSRRSLYEYFYFFPSSRVFEDGVYDGLDEETNTPAGMIHVNGDIGLQWASFQNMLKISCSGKIYQNYGKYASPVYHDRIYFDPVEKKVLSVATGSLLDGRGEYHRQTAEYAYRPAPIWDLDDKFRHWSATGTPYAYINGVKIPFNASTDEDEVFGEPYFEDDWTAWPWNLYTYYSGDANYEDYEIDPITFYVQDEDMRALERTKGLDTGSITDQRDYWFVYHRSRMPTAAEKANADLWESLKPYSAILTEWWMNPDTYRYGPGGDSLEGKPIIGEGRDAAIWVQYLDTYYQADDWQQWANQATVQDGTDRKLVNVLQEMNTGGYYITTPEPKEDFLALAKTGGIFIGYDEEGNFVNQAALYTNIPSGGDPLATTEKFKHPLYAPVVENEVQDTYVFNVNVEELTKNAPAGFNGIVYVDLRHPTDETKQAEFANHDYTVRLHNARRLHAPLTVVSLNQNVQLHGSFNYNPAESDEAVNDANWQPAAVVTYRRIETLSDDFGDSTLGTSELSYTSAGSSTDDVVKPLYYHRLNLDLDTGPLYARYNYPDDCLQDNVFLQTYVYDALTDEDWDSFKVTTPPDKEDFVWEHADPEHFQVRQDIPYDEHQQTLARIGQAQYYLNNINSIIPEARSDTTYKLAMVTPYATDGYVLERWGYYAAYIDAATGQWSLQTFTEAQRNFEGAFIRLPRSFAVETDNEHYYYWQYARYYPSGTNYALSADTLYLRQFSPFYAASNTVRAGDFRADSEGRFLDPNLRPPGDFWGSSEDSWIEIDPQDFFNTTEVTLPPVTTFLPEVTTEPPTATDWYYPFPTGIYDPNQQTEPTTPPPTSAPPETTAPPETAPPETT